MKKIDRRIVIVAALIFTIGLAYGLMRFLIAQKEDPMMRPPLEARRYVKAEPVSYSTIVSPVSAPGRLTSVSTIEVVAEASGKILAGVVPLKKGTQFSRGDLLFTIYPDEAELALKARKSQFMNTLANLLPDISIDFPDQSSVYRKFFSSIDLDKKLPPLPEITDEKLRIFLSSRNVLSDYYSIVKDELQLSRHRVFAPFQGTYTQVYLEAGAYINTGGRVAQAIRTDELELEVPLKRFDAEWVKIGDKVTVTSDQRSLHWQGEVIRKSQFVDENTQSQGIFIKIQNHRTPSLLAGEFLTAIFPGHPIENAMEIPRNAVFNTNEVFIIEEGRLQSRMIRIIKVNEKTLIFNGIEEGSMLVLQPLINVLEGTFVEVLGDAPPGMERGSGNRQQPEGAATEKPEETSRGNPSRDTPTQ